MKKGVPAGGLSRVRSFVVFRLQCARPFTGTPLHPCSGTRAACFRRHLRGSYRDISSTEEPERSNGDTIGARAAPLAELHATGKGEGGSFPYASWCWLLLDRSCCRKATVTSTVLSVFADCFLMMASFTRSCRCFHMCFFIPLDLTLTKVDPRT